MRVSTCVGYKYPSPHSAHAPGTADRPAHTHRHSADPAAQVEWTAHAPSRLPHERAGADIADSSTHAVRHTSPDIPPVRARLRAVLTQRVCPHQCQPCTHHHVVSLPPAVRLLGGSPHAPARNRHIAASAATRSSTTQRRSRRAAGDLALRRLHERLSSLSDVWRLMAPAACGAS